MVSELAQEIYTTMREQELALKIEPDYLSKVQIPTEVKVDNRRPQEIPSASRDFVCDCVPDRPIPVAEAN
jgi:hypothetical protein